MRDRHHNLTRGAAGVVALVVALLVLSPLSLLVASRADDATPTPGPTDTHFVVGPDRSALATGPARVALRRITTCTIRSCVATGGLRLLSFIGLCLLAWRRLRGKRRERWLLPLSHLHDICFVRGPPGGHRLCTSAVSAGDDR